MSRYYEENALIEFVDNNTPTVGGATTIECVMRAIRHAPIADVVPRAEYERVINACKNCREDDIVKAKWEIARGIFAELKTLIDEYIDGFYNTAEFVKIFHELEKKYTERSRYDRT